MSKILNVFFFVFGYVYGWYLALTIEIRTALVVGRVAGITLREVNDGRLNQDVALAYVAKGNEFHTLPGGVINIARLSSVCAKAGYFFAKSGWSEERVADKLAGMERRIDGWVAAYDKR